MEETRNTNNSNFRENILSEKSAVNLLICGSGLIIISAILFISFGDWKFHLNLDETKIAQFGDFIGGVVGSLFALVGVILFYVALKEQRKDFKTNQYAVNLQLKALDQQIDEFKAQREELESTRKIYEQQTKTMKNQQFDSNFYSLLDVYIGIKRNLDSLNAGVDYFENKFNLLEADVNFEDGEALNVFHDRLIAKYENIFLSNRAYLSQYFKTIYRLLKTIDDCEHLNPEEKIFYAKILRSQITNSELLILYYNYHSSFGKKVQSLILKYDFLKHLETLSKVEFLKKFNLDVQNKIELILFTDRLKNLLNINIIAAKDIESTEPIKVQEKYDRFDWIIALEIDENIELRICLNKDITEVFSLTNDKFKEFIYLFLNDELYYNKFIRAENNEIQKSITTDDINLIFNFTITKY